MRSFLFSAAILAGLVTAAKPASAADDPWRETAGWFTLHHDVQRTGRTQDSPGVPFQYVWHRKFFEELICPEVEPTRFTPERHRQEQEFLREQIRGGLLQQTFFLLGADDGTERLVTSVTYSGSENGYSIPTPGPVDFDDRLYVLYKSLYTQYEYPIRRFDCVGRLDRQTGLPEMLPKQPPGRSSEMPITADEVNNFIVGGRRLYSCHDHKLSYYDLDTGRTHAAWSAHAPECWGGVILTGGHIAPNAAEVRDHPLMKGMRRGRESFSGNVQPHGTSVARKRLPTPSRSPFLSSIFLSNPRMFLPASAVLQSSAWEVSRVFFLYGAINS